MKYVKIEDLKNLGDIHINLETLFETATQIYRESHQPDMMARTPHYAADLDLSEPKVTPLPETAKHEKTKATLRQIFCDMPQTYEDLVKFWKRGRELEDQYIPCTTTAHYGHIKASLNEALKTMGFDIFVI